MHKYGRISINKFISDWKKEDNLLREKHKLIETKDRIIKKVIG